MQLNLTRVIDTMLDFTVAASNEVLEVVYEMLSSKLSQFYICCILIIGNISHQFPNIFENDVLVYINKIYQVYMRHT